ncbi:MAG: hypothetical protein ACRD22_16375 [Terriglobia bacterium]
MNDADTEAVTAFIHDKAVDTCAVGIHIGVAIINAVNAQPSIDSRKLTEDVVANLLKTSEGLGEKQALAKWATAFMADTISRAYQEALANGKSEA